MQRLWPRTRWTIGIFDTNHGGFLQSLIGSLMSLLGRMALASSWLESESIASMQTLSDKIKVSTLDYCGEIDVSNYMSNWNSLVVFL